MRPPTGEQHVLTRTTPLGEARAIITELAASLRTLVEAARGRYEFPEAVLRDLEA